MKKIIVAIALALCATVARADNDTGITTSQAYVETKAAEKQDAAPANNANSVMTYDSTSDDGIGAKAIYNESSTYENQTNALLTAGTANGAIQNAIDNEFTCANPPKCTLWHMTGLFPPTLPAGYTELEYIESTGTQWIDTGIAPSNNTGVLIDFQYTNTDKTEQLLFGSIGNNFIFDRLSSLRFAYGYKTGSGITESFNVSTEELTMRQTAALNWMNDGIFSMGNIIQQIPSATFTNTRTMFVFAAGYSDLGWKPMYGRVYSMKISNNVDKVRDFIPAKRNSDGVLGMYDTVTNTFFTNRGTGDFIAGPVASFIPQNQ